MNLLSEIVDFTQIEDQLLSLWLFACQQQFLAQDGRVSWDAAAHAWAAVGRAMPVNARADAAVVWQLAGAAAEKARRERTTKRWWWS